MIKNQFVVQNRKVNMDIPQDFLVNHISGSFVEMVLWWIRGRMKQTPEELDRYFGQSSSLSCKAPSDGPGPRGFTSDFGMLKCRKDAKSVCGGILGKEVKREGGREYA